MFDGDFRKFYLLRCMAIRDTPWRCVFLLLFFLRWEFSIQRLELLGWRSIFFVIQPPKRPEHFRKFRWVGPGTRTTFNPFPNTPRSWCAKNTMCLVSPHHCFRSVGAWLIPKKTWFYPENAWTNTGHAVGPNTVHVFLLTKTLADFVGSKKKIFERMLAPADLQEATIRAGLVYRSVNNAKFDAGHNNEICKP